MGLVFSRFNLDGLHSGRRRSQQDETLYSYSLNKNYFSNYFLMGGERFEVNDPDYLFGDNCDLNFLSCTKPYSLPYKQAQQNLLSNLDSKHKAINKVSSRVNSLGSPFNILTGRHRQSPDLRKQDAQNNQSTNSSKGSNNGSEPSKPLVMFVNIRKETLRLVKSATSSNNDGDISSLTNSISLSGTERKQSGRLTRKHSATSRNSRRSFQKNQQQQSTSRLSATGSGATTATIHPHQGNSNHIEYDEVADEDEHLSTSCGKPCSRKFESDISSLLSATSSTRSGYTSVKDNGPSASSDDSSDVCDEDFKDALNDTSNLSLKDDDDDESEKTQQQKSLLSDQMKHQTKENVTKKTSASTSDACASKSSETKVDHHDHDEPSTMAKGDEEETDELGESSNSGGCRRTSLLLRRRSNVVLTDIEVERPARVYNIEFYFDAEVDCSIRIFYFCTRELGSSGITYKPQHATYKSKIYFYKRGLNQKFDQPEHTFQPYLFDEDLLIYKPLDTDGNYNSGAVFPIVIHCVALEGPTPRQSHSLVATIEKSQLDDSYSIKPLKQLIFVDGVQYILQDIYGIEHKQLHAKTKSSSSSTLAGARPSTPSEKDQKISTSTSNLKKKSSSLRSNSNTVSNLNLSDSTSLASVDLGLGERGRRNNNRGSLISNQHKSLGSENTFECVVCMSEERDTMLLPCRHLCLCSSCAQSLRYQANSCPICRCPFKAALNLRPIQQRHLSTTSTTTAASNTSTG